MKKIIYVLTAIFVLSACNKLDIKPVSILQDEQVFTSPNGVAAYFAGLYNRMPVEDLKFDGNGGYNQFSAINSLNTNTGEIINKNKSNVDALNLTAGTQNGSLWSDCYVVIRQANYVLETLPTYASKFTTVQVNNWLGEALFIRAFTYFEMAKRWGGVPLVLDVQNYPQQSIDELKVARNSEQEVYDQIGKDCDQAISLMGTTNDRGRANKFAAAALKSRAMLFAGSIAKYNVKNTADPATNKRVQGIPSSEAVRYFKASYEASKLVETGGYKLYRSNVATPADKVVNYVKLFTDPSAGNTEAIFIREYSVSNSATSFDCMAVPWQMMGPPGYSAYVDPTEDLVELFDGLPKNADGTLKTTDANGKYIYYGITPTATQTPYSTFKDYSYAAPAAGNIITDVNTPSTNNIISNAFGIFQNAEPRLLATVVVPGSIMKGQIVDIRRGIYTGDISNGITQFDPSSYAPYNNIPGIVQCNARAGTPIVDISNPAIGVPAGTKINAGGLSGIYGSRDGGTMSGYTIRKYVDQTLPQPQTTIPNSGPNQLPWLEIRYAEIELNRAEAAWELNAAGQNDGNYMQDAYNMIHDIQDRAGATTSLITSPADLIDVNIIRKERRKELFGENKIYWDMIRWRTFDTEVNNKEWAVINPIYVVANGKYIYDRRKWEANRRWTFTVSAYYSNIPGGEITKNPKLYQNQ